MTRRLHDQRTGVDRPRGPNHAGRRTNPANNGHRHHPTAATPTPSNPVTTAVTPGLGLLVTAILSGAFLAALITATINLWLARRRSREEERNRLRNSFAEAFAAYSAYKEFPYAIRRRRADVAAEERIRLSEALREIQASLAYHLAWTTTESETVGQAYTNLVQQVRRTAGAAMHEAWKAPPTESDDTMNIPPSVIDLSPLAPHSRLHGRGAYPPHKAGSLVGSLAGDTIDDPGKETTHAVTVSGARLAGNPWLPTIATA